MKIFTVAFIFFLSVLLPLASMSSFRLHLNHPTHSSISRHALTISHQKLPIHHNMRVFNQQHASHLTHEATSNENYHLDVMGYYFTLNFTIAGLPYRLTIDTGSSDIFIKGEQSPGNPIKKYTCPKCFEKNQHIEIGYLDGFLNTYENKMEVNFGPHTFNQSILVAYTAPKTFETHEGLVGLSFAQQALNSEPTFIQTLINNKIISEYAFGVNLNFQQHGRSFISFGKPDKELFEGQFNTYNISKENSYSILAVAFSFEGDKIPNFLPFAILDTGNTCISIPEHLNQKVLDGFNAGSNVCGFDLEVDTPKFSLLRCKVRNFDELPVLNIIIQGDQYPIDKDAYLQRCIRSDDGDLCDTYIESVKGQYTLFLGDGFFSRYYAYFDVGKRQIGLAKNKEVLSYKRMYKEPQELDEEDKQFYADLK